MFKFFKQVISQCSYEHYTKSLEEVIWLHHQKQKTLPKYARRRPYEVITLDHNGLVNQGGENG